MLPAEPTYNRTRLALAWRARILSQKTLRNVSRLSPGLGTSLAPSAISREGVGCGNSVPRGHRDLVLVAEAAEKVASVHAGSAAPAGRLGPSRSRVVGPLEVEPRCGLQWL